MITLNNLHLTLDNWHMTVDLTIESGAFCALIGPSGAGKTTILNAIAGFLPHGEGQLFIDGQDMAEKAPNERPVSMLFQDHNLFAHLTIAQNVALGVEPTMRLNTSQWSEVDQALAQTGLEGLGDRLPKALSGGQRQRASLARAILRKKPVLLLDEPFAALGPALRQSMLDLVKSLTQKAGQTVILVTHHPEDAQKAATHTALVHDGTIAQAGPTEEIFTNPSAQLAAYMGI